MLETAQPHHGLVLLLESTFAHGVRRRRVAKVNSATLGARLQQSDDCSGVVARLHYRVVAETGHLDKRGVDPLGLQGRHVFAGQNGSCIVVPATGHGDDPRFRVDPTNEVVR